MRWALPDRVFFACGGCHILAYAFLQRCARPDAHAIWIKPDAGFLGNHVFVDCGDIAFDYHGWSSKSVFLAHVWRRSVQRWPGWNASLVPLPADVLISESKSRAYEGLWLREPTQFLHDALPRAHAYVARLSKGHPTLDLATHNG